MADNTMDTRPNSTHERTDSGTYITDSTTNTFTVVQNFSSALSSLASKNGVQALSELVATLPQLKNHIKAKDETIRDLEAKIVTLDKSQSTFNQQQISNFEERYDEWKESNVELQEDIEKLEISAEEKTKEITILQMKLQDNKVRIEDFEKEHTKIMKRLKEMSQQAVELEMGLNKKQMIVEGREEELRKSHEQVVALQRSLKEEVNDHRSLREVTNKAQARLRELEQFSVKTHTLELPEV
jgi:chromosome segregation ATPase